MIVTLTTNVHGHQRLYLGGTGSFEIWLEKAEDGRHWTLHTANGLGGNHLAEADKRATAAHRLMALCEMLGCKPDDLPHVPFQVLASLHVSDVRENRRMATPRKSIVEHAYMATAPDMRRPRADFRSEHFEEFRRRR